MDTPELPVLSFKTPADWEAWLSKNHEHAPGVWLRLYKKNGHVEAIEYNEALDEALCYGWIDSQVKKYDDISYIQKFTPRKTKSVWSKINRDHIERLIRAKKMKPSGMKLVEEAKQNGRWESAYDASSTMTVPEDFLFELAKDKKAEAFFATLNKANVYAIVWRLQTALKPETRRKRMTAILTMLAKGEKFH